MAKKKINFSYVSIMANGNPKDITSYATTNFSNLIGGTGFDQPSNSFIDYKETNDPKIIGTFVTGKFGKKLYYVDDLEGLMRKNPQIKHSVDIIVNKNSPISKTIMDAIDEVIKTNKGVMQIDKSTWRMPYIDGDIRAEELEKDDKNGDHYKSCWIFKFISKSKVKFFTGKRLPMTVENDDDIEGRYCAIGGSCKPYFIHAQSKGIALYLNMLMLLKKNPAFDFSKVNPDDFEEFEDDNEEEMENNFEAPVDSNDEDVPFK